MKQKAIKIGLYAGLLMVFWEALALATSWYGTALRYAYFINLVFLVFGILILFRDLLRSKRKGEESTFNERFGLSFRLSVVAALVYFVGSLLLYNVVFTEAANEIIEFKELTLLNTKTEAQAANSEIGNVSDERSKLVMERIKWKYTLPGMMTFWFFGTLAAGLFVSLMLSTVFNKNE